MHKLEQAIVDSGVMNNNIYTKVKTLGAEGYHDILFSGVEITENYILYFKDGEFHREDGAAVQYTDGSGDEYWYLHGKKVDKFDAKFAEAHEKFPERFV